MPVELTWMIPDKILLSRWIGDISSDDLGVLVEELEIVFDEATTLIHTVIDLSRVGFISPGIVYAYLQSRIPYHVRRGRLAAVPVSAQSQGLASHLNHTTQREMLRVFETHDQAREFLLQHDTPPPLLMADAAENDASQRPQDNKAEGSTL